MRAVCLSGQLCEKPSPGCGPRQVRVRVQAAGLNRADLLQMRGLYPAPPGAPTDILGLEYAGVVAETGTGVTRVQLGDRVMGIIGGGAFSEEVIVHEGEVLEIPAGLSFEEAAAIPEAFITAFDALTLQGRLQAGDTVLIHAVASGVGTAALQWISSQGGTVIGTSRTADKLARCASAFGLKHGILCPSEPRFAEEVRRLTGGNGAELALDLVGGAYVAETLKAMRPLGRVVLVGLTAGSVAQVSLSTLLSRRLTLMGTVLRSRSLEEKVALADQFRRQVLPGFARKSLQPVVDRVFSMAHFSEAVRRLEANESFGKTILTWENSAS